MKKTEARAALAAIDAEPPAINWREARRKREAADRLRRILRPRRPRRMTAAEVEALPF